MRGTRIRAYVHTYKGDARSNYLCDNDLDLEFRLSCSLFLSSPFSLVFPLPWEYIENKWTVQIRIIFFRYNNKVIKRKTYTHTYTQRHLVAPLTHTHSYFWQSSESSLLPRTNIPLFVPFRYTLDVPSFLSISLSLSISLTLFLASLPFPLRCTHSRYTHRKRRDQAKRNE